MADVQYNWPAQDQARLIGKRHHRVDGLAKASGAAKYTYDVNLPKQLIVRALSCPHAHCRIANIDVSEAKKTPGVVHVHIFPHAEVGKEINWEGELLIAVAAETEGAAAEGVDRLRLAFEVMPAFVDDENLQAATDAQLIASGGGRAETENEPSEDADEDAFIQQEIDRLLKESAHVVEGYYGADVITHCCLEPHGSTVAWDGGKLTAYLSTQNVSGTDEGFASALQIGPEDVEVICQYIGGGFGSKFAPDYWSIAAAQIAKATGRPVKFMLTREQELKLGGHRPSGYIKVRLGADQEGVVQVWDSTHWGSGGFTGGAVSQTVIPYVFRPKNLRVASTNIKTNVPQARAWRAPGHPQACAMSQTAFDDLAAKMGADSLEIFRKNVANIAPQQKPEVYLAEMEIAARLMDWKAKWHPHGKGPAQGSVVEGLGLSLHTWGGAGHASNCTLKIFPTGGVESFCGTQDLGTGTRTVCAVVLAETLGLNVADVKVNIGTSKLPVSGPSGGSTTVAGVSESHRRAAQNAVAQLFEIAAPKLNTTADQLEVAVGRIQVRGKPDQGLSWKEVCALLGMKPLEVTGVYQPSGNSPLSGSGVGGVQMAHVAVDRETGVVRMKKFVAVQDMGLIINRTSAESQINGAVIMGIAYALFEQRIMDPATGGFVNSSFDSYHLPRLGDVGEIVVELYEPEDQRQRGVIGLGEPPVIGPGAAIANAVCNALGVRVPVIPLTPQRVLEAIQKSAVRA